MTPNMAYTRDTSRLMSGGSWRAGLARLFRGSTSESESGSLPSTARPSRATPLDLQCWLTCSCAGSSPGKTTQVEVMFSLSPLPEPWHPMDVASITAKFKKAAVAMGLTPMRVSWSKPLTRNEGRNG